PGARSGTPGRRLSRDPGRSRSLCVAGRAGGTRLNFVSVLSHIFPGGKWGFFKKPGFRECRGRNRKEGEVAMDFRPLNDTERRQLISSLRGNADGNRVILMDRRDTSFIGSTEEVPDEEVINAIKSVPCHY